MYDYYLGGSHSFAVDRLMAEQAIAMWPDLPRIAFANRAFLQRSVCFLTEQGIDQGGRIFSEEFAEFMRPTHGECGPDCWCHSSAEDAEACLADRQAHGAHEHS